MKELGRQAIKQQKRHVWANNRRSYDNLPWLLWEFKGADMMWVTQMEVPTIWPVSPWTVIVARPASVDGWDRFIAHSYCSKQLARDGEPGTGQCQQSGEHKTQALSTDLSPQLKVRFRLFCVTFRRSFLCSSVENSGILAQEMGLFARKKFCVTIIDVFPLSIRFFITIICELSS